MNAEPSQPCIECGNDYAAGYCPHGKKPSLVKDARKAPLRSEGCSMRVWDNGDTDNCGKLVIVGGLCEEHREMVVRSLQEMIRNSRDSIAKAERRLAELLDDGVLDTIDLKKAL